MVEIFYYLVPKEIAERSGLMGKRYRVTDGRFVFDSKDLSIAHVTEEEMSDVEQIDERTATSLIARNNYRMGAQGTTYRSAVITEAETSANQETEQGAEEDTESAENAEEGETEENEEQEIKGDENE